VDQLCLLGRRVELPSVPEHGCMHSLGLNCMGVEASDMTTVVRVTTPVGMGSNSHEHWPVQITSPTPVRLFRRCTIRTRCSSGTAS